MERQEALQMVDYLVERGMDNDKKYLAKLLQQHQLEEADTKLKMLEMLIKHFAEMCNLERVQLGFDENNENNFLQECPYCQELHLSAKLLACGLCEECYHVLEFTSW